jgi:beta-N-acetylhexosaminidase
MAGVRAGRDVGEVAVAALEAGVDQLILTRDEPRAHAAVVAAVRSGRLSERRLDASVRRILRAKAWAGLADAPVVPAAPAGERPRRTSAAGAAQAQRRAQFATLAAPDPALLRRSAALAEAVARAAVTVVQPSEGPVPFVGPEAPGRILTLVLDDSEDPATGTDFVEAVAASVPEGGQATHRRLGVGDPERRSSSG